MFRSDFTAAEFGLVYSSVYRALCRESHNNVGALNSRHFRHEDGKLQVVIFKTPDDLDVTMILDSITSTLCTAGCLLTTTSNPKVWLSCFKSPKSFNPGGNPTPSPRDREVSPGASPLAGYLLPLAPLPQDDEILGIRLM